MRTWTEITEIPEILELGKIPEKGGDMDGRIGDAGDIEICNDSRK